MKKTIQSANLAYLPKNDLFDFCLKINEDKKIESLLTEKDVLVLTDIFESVITERLEVKDKNELSIFLIDYLIKLNPQKEKEIESFKNQFQNN